MKRNSQLFCLTLLAAMAGWWMRPSTAMAQGASPGVGSAATPGVTTGGKPSLPPGSVAPSAQSGTQGEQVNSSMPLTTLQLQTKLVSLDVVVVDHDGKPVGGLKKNDFTIYEDNKPSPTRNFDGWESRAEVPLNPTVDKYGRPSWGESPLAGKAANTVSVTFEVENRSLAWTIGTNGTYTADATAVLVGMDAKKVVDGSAAFRLRPYLTTPNAPQRFDGSLTVRDELPLNAKVATVKLIVRDSSGRIGTAVIPADKLEGLLPQGGGKRK